MDNTITAVTKPPTGSLRSSFLLWLVWILWLPLFIPSIVSLIQGRPSAPRLLLSIFGAVAFFALYLWISWQSARALAAHVPRMYPTGIALSAPIIALVGLGIGLTLWDGYNWGALLYYVASGVAGWLQPRKAAVVIAGLALFVAVVLSVKGDYADAIMPIVFVLVIGAIVIAFNWSLTNSQQLHFVREEMERSAAINEERLRIARDLHDLLGHNLSLIALKSELAHRLIAVDPERAATEIGDIERVARTALQEVREAVTNYRTPTLTSELHKVPDILAAAGISYRLEGDERGLESLSAPAEAALSWAIREGITNVIRHSRARQCAIRLTAESAGVLVEVIDDGAGPAGTGPAGTKDGNVSGNVSGNGLRGLAERVAALGGRIEAGPCTDAGVGFRLAVWIPAVPPSPSPDVWMDDSPAAAISARGESGSASTSPKGEAAR